MEYRPPPLPEGLPPFTGKEDIQWWLEEHDFYCWNHYFDTESEWLCVALRHLQDEALEWVYQQTWPELNWSILKEAMRRDFGKQVQKESERPEVSIPVVEENVLLVEDVNTLSLDVGIISFPLNFSASELEPYIAGEKNFDKSIMDESRDISLEIYVLWSPPYLSLEPTYTGFARVHMAGMNGAKIRPPPEPPPIENTGTLRTRFFLMGAGIDTVQFSDQTQAQCPTQQPNLIAGSLDSSGYFAYRMTHGLKRLLCSYLAPVKT